MMEMKLLLINNMVNSKLLFNFDFLISYFTFPKRNYHDPTFFYRLSSLQSYNLMEVKHSVNFGSLQYKNQTKFLFVFRGCVCKDIQQSTKSYPLKRFWKL